MKHSPRLVAWCAAVAVLALAACATLPPPSRDDSPLQRREDGTAVLWDEFAFTLPSAAWNPMYGERDGEFVIAFVKRADCPAPCQSSFVYDEEPFGHSRDPETRLQQFMPRFLWASRVVFGTPEVLSTGASGRGPVVAVVEGADTPRGQKVRAKLVFTRRHERVVAFYYTQWRPLEAPFALEDETVFDRFVQSFFYRQRSFYETLSSP